MSNFNTSWSKFIKEMELDTSGIRVNDNLEPNFWQDMEIDEEARSRLLQIAKDFIKSLDLMDKVVDITLTGSLATYNWHDKSDIDLHILVDFGKIGKDKDLYRDFLDLKRASWNEKHDIFMHGYEVEMYFQDADEDHFANGVYSIMKNRWVTKPSRESVNFDTDGALIKAKGLAREIDNILEHIRGKKFSHAYECSEKIRKKIKNMRSSGLKDEGIYSIENLAFKILRNSGYLEKLSNLRHLSYDKKMSYNDFEPVNVKIDEQWWKFIKS